MYLSLAPINLGLLHSQGGETKHHLPRLRQQKISTSMMKIVSCPSSYQVATSHLSLNQPANHLKYSTDARIGTVVAFTYINKQVFVYYTNETNEEYEVRTKDCKDGWRWGPSSGIDGAPSTGSLWSVDGHCGRRSEPSFLSPAGFIWGEFTHVRDELSS